jgi:hypothetical protein
MNYFQNQTCAKLGKVQVLDCMFVDKVCSNTRGDSFNTAAM